MGTRRTLLGRMILFLTAAIFLFVLTIGAVSYLILSSNLENKAMDDMKSAQKQISDFFSLKERQARTSASLAAQNQEISKALLSQESSSLQRMGREFLQNSGLDFITFVDAQGIVAARGHAEGSGDSLQNQKNVLRSLAGESSAGYERSGASKLAYTVTVPLRNGGTVVGAILAGFIVHGNEALADEVKALWDSEFTVFDGDTRVATTILKEGKRAVGTSLDNREVLDRVLTKGESFHGQIKLFGQPYNTVYWPIQDPSGANTGMFFIGKSRAHISATYKGLFTALFATFAVMGTLLLLAFGAYIKALLKGIHHAIARARELAEGEADLTKRLIIGSNDEIGDLASEFNRFLNRIEELVKEIKSTSAKVRERSFQLSSTAEELTATSSQQESQATSVASALEELAATSNDIAKTLESTQGTVTLSVDTTKKGSLSIEASHSSMETIQSQTANLNAILHELGSSIATIGNILSVIHEVSDQTNLLALNAAIEAARAGEAGRGFAVVADEVRKLAERTAGSTKEIGTIIQGLQKSSSKAQQAMEETSRQVEESARLGKESLSTLEAIIKGSEEVLDATTTISSAITQENATIEEVNSNIQGIAQGTSQSVNALKETALVTQELSDLADQMKTLTDRFKTS